MIDKFGDMEITSGDEHDFLRTKIKVNKDKTVTIDMREQIRNTINLFEGYDNSVNSETSTPAANYLFAVDPDADNLIELIVKFFIR